MVNRESPVALYQAGRFGKLRTSTTVVLLGVVLVVTNLIILGRQTSKFLRNIAITTTFANVLPNCAFIINLENTEISK